jgi:hypothetical protein
MPAQLTWVGGSLDAHGQYTGGDPTAWSNPLNWLQKVTPQAGDTVLFTDNVTEQYVDSNGNGFTHQGPEDFNSTVDAAFTVAGLTVDGTYNYGSHIASLSVNNPLAITGNLVLESPSVSFGGNGAMSIAGSGSLWTAGELQVGTGGLLNTGTLTLDSAEIPLLQGDLNLYGGGTFQNAGIINQVGNGNLQLGGGGYPTTVLDNLAGAVYDFQSDTGITYYQVGAVINAGTMEKTGGTGTTSISPFDFSNQGGTLEVNSGTLSVAAWDGEASANTSTGGNFVVAAGCTLELAGFPHAGATDNYTGTYIGSGGGQILMDQGYLNVEGAGATFNMPVGMFHWTGGYITLNGNLTNAASGVMSFDTGNGNYLYLEGTGSLLNAGTIDHTGTGYLDLYGTYNADGSYSPTALVNQAGAIYNFQSDAGITYYRDGTVTNLGTIEKTGGTSVSYMNPFDFSNQGGTLEATSGTLQIDAGDPSTSASANTSTGGSFITAAGASIELTGYSSVDIYTGTYTGSGAGQVLMDHAEGSLVVGAAGATFNMPAGMFHWTGGYIQMTGNLTNSGTLTFDTTQTNLQLYGAGTLFNAGTIDETGGNYLELVGEDLAGNPVVTSLVNQAGAVYNLQSDGGITYYVNGVVTNAGTIEKTAGTSTSFLEATSFSNTGTVAVHTGTINANGPVAQVSGSTLTGGFWEAFGSSTVPATLSLSGSQSLTTIAAGALVELKGPNSSFSNLFSNPSALNTIAGKFEVLSGASFSTAGDLTVSGSGLLYVGAGSTLTVNGNFDLTAKATLQIGLGGTSKAPTIGQLQATGTVTLAGKLKLTATSKPAVGSAFEIVNNEGSAAISGIFAGLPEGATFVVNGMTFKISYVGGTGNDVTITRVA